MNIFARSTSGLLSLMTLALALFYLSGAALPALLGLALFGALALIRPDLALLFVPLTAPLYLIPAAIAGLRAEPVLLPLHEAALVITGAAAGARWLWRTIDRRRPTTGHAWVHVSVVGRRSSVVAFAAAYAPHLLLVLAGALGVLLAVERSRALREFRWVIAEPLLLYVLIKAFAQGVGVGSRGLGVEDIAARSSSSVLRPPSSVLDRLLIALVLSGAIVGLLGLLQYAGVDLVPLLGRKQCFAPDGGICSNIVTDGGLRRVLSVYGHPNNLGLALGRIWPLGAALAAAPLLAGWRRGDWADNHARQWRIGGWFFAICTLLCLGGLVVSFSRGAWLGAVAALAVLVLGFLGQIRDKQTSRQADKEHSPGLLVSLSRSSLIWSVGLVVTVLVLAGLALSLRGDVTAGSTPIRLLLWREALGYIGRHPLGIGLDQFGIYHDPASGRSLIDPALIGTSEQYAAHPHNLLLDIWLQLGPIGIAAFGWLLARFFRDGRRHTNRPIVLGALAAMVAALAHGLVDNFYFVSDLAIIFWLLIAFVELAYTKTKTRGT